MISNKNRKLLLFVTLCVILAGIVSATDGESDSCVLEDTISDETSDTTSSVSQVNDNVISDDNNKNINVIKSEKNTKTATGKIKTKASIDYVPTVSVDDSLFISGTLTDANNN
ncbi:MAG: hypothetical protein BZ137_02815, partial [Methanosphaera sp. rholeuAM130]